MRLKSGQLWFIAFTAVFATAAVFIFWGTWSIGISPVMPDCPLPRSENFISSWLDGWARSGKFIPDDIRVFLGPPAFWAELQYVLAAFFAALGMVYYCRGRGLPRLAAYGAGLMLAFCGYWFSLFSAGHLGWFRWMTYGVFAFGLADRAVRQGKWRHWVLLGACVAWASFYQSDLWLLFTVFTSVYFVWCCVRERKLPWKGALAGAAVFFIIGAPSFRSALVGDLKGRDEQIKSGVTVGADVKDEDMRRWLFVTNWSLPPAESAEFFIPRINGDTSCPFVLSLGARNRTGVTRYTGALGRPYKAPAGNYRQHSLYVGFITIAFALCGLWCGRRKGEVVFFASAAAVFWLFSLGRYCEIVYRMVYALPFGDYLRAPVKWHHLTEFCICVLAAYGIAGASRFLSGAGRYGRFLVPALVLVGVADIVRVNRLYCAPQEISRTYTFVSREQAADVRFDAQLRAVGGKVAGRCGDLVCIGIPKEKPAPLKRKPRPAPSFLALLSLAGTAGVSVFAAVSAVRRRR